MMKHLIYPALALMAAPALAQAMAPAEYVAAAGASDLFERESAQTMLNSTQNPKIRNFAQTMIRDHTKSTDMVKAAAMRSGVHAGPPMLTPQQSEMLSQLRSQSGTARDATYITQQKQAHQQALAVHRAYATNGTDPALKTAAAQIVPVVEHHIAMLNNM